MVRFKLSRAGFTLIEMLVVIGIIAILAGILFPVLSNARHKGFQATCFSNLMQLGQAFKLYINDNSGYFPPWCASNPDPNVAPDPKDKPAAGIVTWDVPLVTDYLQGKTATVVCPSNPMPKTVMGTGAAFGTCRSYAMARYTQRTKLVSGQTVYVGGYVAMIPNPSQTVLLFEKGTNLPGSWGDALGENVYQSHGSKGQTDPGYTEGMFHFGGKNFLFVDGSVKLYKEGVGAFAWNSGRTDLSGEQNAGPGVCEIWGLPANGGDWPPLS
jgi:prepilin-type N-terminal cleavage/methylation domain-containing protein/prepilin-type processing-associated H-X9-DG protein